MIVPVVILVASDLCYNARLRSTNAEPYRKIVNEASSKKKAHALTSKRNQVMFIQHAYIVVIKTDLFLGCALVQYVYKMSDYESQQLEAIRRCHTSKKEFHDFKGNNLVAV